MKIIDAHVHFSQNRGLSNHAEQVSLVDYSLEGYLKECAANGVVSTVCMGSGERSNDPDDPNQIDHPMLADLTQVPPAGMFVCAGINPYRIDDTYLEKLRDLVRKKSIVGFKIYSGYYHVDVYDPVYAPVYRIAAEYDMPVALHCGDTFAETALLEYAHPLRVDRLAVNWRDVTFIICHMGSPWIYDATGVAFKNRNVYMDMSGLALGSAEGIAGLTASNYWVDRYQDALDYLEDCDKLLFGTDWPLVPMAEYIEYIKKIIPERFWDAVFYENSIKVYKLPLI